MIALGGVGHRQNGDKVALVGAHVGDEALGAVDDILVAIQHRGGLDVGGVGAGVGLGEGEAGDPALGGAGQVLLLLLGGAVLDDAGDGHGVYAHHLGGAGALAGQLGDHQGLLHHAKTGAAVLLGHADAHEAHLTQLLQNGGLHTLIFIHLGGDGGQLFIGKLLGQGLDHFLSFRQLKSHVFLPPV